MNRGVLFGYIHKHGVDLYIRSVNARTGNGNLTTNSFTHIFQVIFTNFGRGCAFLDLLDR